MTGYCGDNANIKTSSQGLKIAEFTVVSKDGDKRLMRIDFTSFGKCADRVEEMAKKSMPIEVRGRISQNTREGKTYTQFICEEIKTPLEAVETYKPYENTKSQSVIQETNPNDLPFDIVKDIDLPF